MNEQDLLKIIEALTEKTKNKKALWQTTASNSTYQLRLESGIITVGIDGKKTMKFNVFNTSGKVVENYTYSVPEKLSDDERKDPAPPMASACLQLIQAVFEYITRKEETLKGIAEEILSDASLGKEEEDVPF